MGQIGTIGLETQNSGTVKVPVFATGDSGSNVYEMVRVQTASGTGFIPVVDPADASFPYLRVQTQNHGVCAVHDSSSLIYTFDPDTDSISGANGWSFGEYQRKENPNNVPDQWVWKQSAYPAENVFLTKFNKGSGFLFKAEAYHTYTTDTITQIMLTSDKSDVQGGPRLAFRYDNNNGYPRAIALREYNTSGFVGSTYYNFNEGNYNPVQEWFIFELEWSSGTLTGRMKKTDGTLMKELTYSISHLSADSLYPAIYGGGNYDSYFRNIRIEPA